LAREQHVDIEVALASKIEEVEITANNISLSGSAITSKAKPYRARTLLS
jgi:flagellar basal body rod protein FlgC